MAYSKDEIENIFNKIFKEMVSNGKSLRNILTMEGMPDISTFYVWLEQDSDKSKQYAQAIKMRADILFDEMIDIADDGTRDYIEQDIGDGIITQKFDHEHVQRSRLRIDTRKWVIERMNAKKYNDKYIDNNEVKVDKPIEIKIVK